MTDGGSGHADTTNSGPTRAACQANLRDHAVRLRKRRGRHCLRRRCEGEEASNSNQPEHCFSSCFSSLTHCGGEPPKMDQYHCSAERWLNAGVRGWFLATHRELIEFIIATVLLWLLMVITISELEICGGVRRSAFRPALFPSFPC